MNRFRDRAGKGFALVAAIVAFAAATIPAPVRAEDATSLWFAGTRLILAHPSPMAGDIAVSVNDPGLRRFLNRLGATLSYLPGQSYAIVTTADRRTLTFTIGDPKLNLAGVTTRAPFAPFIENGEAYLPFLVLAHALYVEPIRTDGETVLQPQIGALDVQTQNRRTVVTIHGATPLHFKKTEDANGRLTLVFAGVGSALAPDRGVGSPALGTIDVTTNRSPRNPSTTITFIGPADGQRGLAPAIGTNDVALAFAARGTPLAAAPIPGDAAVPAAGSIPSASTTPLAVTPPSPVASLPAAVAVTSLDVQPYQDGVSVHVGLSGTVAYEWHRLDLGDHRWYVDLRGATLGVPAHEERPEDPAVQSIRIAQLRGTSVPTVRVAMTLSDVDRIDLIASDDGFTISVPGDPAIDVARTGAGQIGNGRIAIAAAPPVVQPAPASWKFSPPATSPIAPPPPPGSNPRLIVIDPGHGGSDSGAQHNGLTEKELTFDISQRLRSILVARGWQVKMTRNTDIDVAGPNAEDRAELQARCDVANNAGARLFVSVHINSFVNGSQSGTTTYYYKPQDRAFAAAIQRHLMSILPTKDDGVRRENFYVVRHTTMPSVLVETAFLSNLGDAALLRQPSFLQNVALGIADGVKEYVGTPRSVPVSAAGDQ